MNCECCQSADRKQSTEEMLSNKYVKPKKTEEVNWLVNICFRVSGSEYGQPAFGWTCTEPVP